MSSHIVDLKSEDFLEEMLLEKRSPSSEHLHIQIPTFAWSLRDVVDPESSYPCDIRINLHPLVRLAPMEPKAMRALQSWEGVVESLGDETFWATLHDLTNPENPPEVAEIWLEELAEEDRELLRVGAVFYWTIMYDDTSGSRSRRSDIRMKRMPRWSRGEIDRLKSEAAALFTKLSQSVLDDSP